MNKTIITDIPVKVVIADLKSKYSEIEQEKDKRQFFVKIAHYGKYILENRFTITVLNPLYQEAKDDAEPYLKSYREFINVWREHAEDILEKVEGAGIQDNLSNNIGTIKSLLDNLGNKEALLRGTDIDKYYDPYQRLIWKLVDLGKSDLLVPKHLEPKDNKRIVIYQQYQKTRDEWDKFKVSRKAKVWWAHYQICRLAAGVLDLEICTDYFKRDNIIDGFYKYEFNQLAKGNINSTPIVLRADRYEVWIKRLHEYLLPRLQELSMQTTQYIENKQKKSTVLSKRELRKKLNNLIIKTGKFGRKERAFLRFLSKDFGPKTIEEIGKEVDTRACTKLKAVVQKKLKGTGFDIKTDRGDWERTATYQLEYLLPSENS